MIRIGDLLIISKINNINVNETIKTNSTLFLDGTTYDVYQDGIGIAINMYYNVDNNDEFIIPKVIYTIYKDTLYENKFYSMMYNDGVADIAYIYNNSFKIDSLYEKVNLLNMVYNSDDEDGLTKEQIEQLIMQLEQYT